MTEIKTAQAWGYVTKWGGINCETTCVEGQHENNDPVVIVHGLTEAEVHEAAALLAKSREVCEWAKSATDPNSEDADYAPIKCLTESMWNIPNYCPSCGRKVVVK